MNISFYGAARTVTGSCYLIETGNTKFLVDCGLFQGRLSEQMLNYEKFPFNPNEIDFMILTHAHIDHSGRIPKLFKEGFKGRVYTTKATKDLASIMLPDSGHIQESEIAWVNRKRKRAGKKPTNAMYTVQDAIDTLEFFEGIRYDDAINITDNIKVIFRDAGHMLGSSIIELFVTEDDVEKKIVFSGDLGNDDMPILNDPDDILEADYLIMESTYGNRLHGDIEDQSNEFIDTIITTIERGGNVIIPSFAVGRTQEILYELNKYLAEKNASKSLKDVHVYVDSPLAVNATRVFEGNPECYDEEALKYLLQGNNPLDFPNLHMVLSSDESKALNEDPTPKVIISASGMCEVGRIKHHLKHNLYRPESTIIFVGYQAKGTLGNRLRSGEKLVKIFGEEIAVNAEIKALDAFSGHADKNGLLSWIDSIKDKPKNIFLTHGEYTGQVSLKSEIVEKFQIPVIIPALNEKYTIEGEPLEIITTYSSKRFNIIEDLAGLKEDMDKLSHSVKKDLKHNLSDEELATIKNNLKEIESAMEKIKDIGK